MIKLSIIAMVMNISINNIVLELPLKSSILHTNLVNMTIISDMLQNKCLQQTKREHTSVHNSTNNDGRYYSEQKKHYKHIEVKPHSS